MDVLVHKCQPCADNNYKHLPSTRIPYRHLEEREHSVEVNQRNKIFRTCIIIGHVILLTLITAMIVSIVSLYSKCNQMNSEITQIKRSITDLNIKTDVVAANDPWSERIDTNEHDYSGDQDTGNGEVVLTRGKRNTRNRSKKERRQRENDKKSVIHLIINERHEDIDVNHPDLRTKERGAVIPYWKYSDNGFNYEQTFATLNEPDGTITIKKSGMYFIYSQVTYFDRSGRWSHMISVNDQPFIKCLASEWGIEVDPDTGVHFNTIHQCYTAAVTHIAANKKIKMHGMYPDRVIHPDRELTYWGVLKLA